MSSAEMWAWDTLAVAATLLTIACSLGYLYATRHDEDTTEGDL